MSEFDDEEGEFGFEFEDVDSFPESEGSFDDIDSGEEDLEDEAAGASGGDDSVDISSRAIGSGGGTLLYRRNRVSYIPWTLGEFIQTFFLDKAVGLNRGQLPQCSLDEILVMLQYKNWQTENVINAFYDDQTRFKDACGLAGGDEGGNGDLGAGFRTSNDFFCSVCCEEYSVIDTYSLTCNHRFCHQCYYMYIKGNLQYGQLIRCIQVNCQLTIPHRDIDVIVNKQENLVQKLERPMSSNMLLVSSARVFIETNKLKWRWCPAPDCCHLTELVSRKNDKGVGQETTSLDIMDVPIVTCPDSHEFCYDCQYENHLPCPCWLVELWVKKCQDDSETANWIQANTQGCPNCGSVIEKNGGCNHMSCPKCSYEFCWICLSSWKQHGSSFYKCNRFDPEETEAVKKLQQLKRLSLQRYLHFYKRFSIHESSMDGDKRMIQKIDSKMKQYMDEELKKPSHSQKNLSWVDIQFLHDAIRALTHGRKTLKWTYCFAFYLAKTNFSEIFEQMQDFLNKIVEDLSLLFEEINDKKHNANSSKVIMKHKQEIINLSNLIVKRQKLLIECAYSGLNQNLLLIETS